MVLHEIPEHDKAAIVDALREDGFVLVTLDPGASDRQVRAAMDVLYDLAREAGVSALVTSTRDDGFVNLAVETVEELR